MVDGITMVDLTGHSVERRLHCGREGWEVSVLFTGTCLVEEESNVKSSCMLQTGIQHWWTLQVQCMIYCLWRCLVFKITITLKAIYKAILQLLVWGDSVAGVVVWRSQVQGLHAATSGTCFSVVPSSNPWSPFVNSQLVCLLPVGTFNSVTFVWNICASAISVN